jgi:hypothetical protein
VSGATAPTAITAGETSVATTFAGSLGTWTWLLYGATASDTDGYYFKIVTSGATQDATLTSLVAGGWAGFAADVNTGLGQEVGLVKYLVDADDANSGAEIMWTVTYTNGAAAFAAAALTQTFAAAGTVTATGTTLLPFATGAGANIWVLYSWESAWWVAATAQPSCTLIRLTPEENTTTDARPVVGETAAAYYFTATVATADVATKSVSGTSLTGSPSGLAAPIATLTWAGAASLSAAAATVAVAALF